MSHWIFVKQNAVPWDPTAESTMDFNVDFSAMSYADNTQYTVNAQILDETGSHYIAQTNGDSASYKWKHRTAGFNGMPCAELLSRHPTNAIGSQFFLWPTTKTVNLSNGFSDVSQSTVFDASTHTMIAFVVDYVKTDPSASSAFLFRSCTDATFSTSSYARLELAITGNRALRVSAERVNADTPFLEQTADNFVGDGKMIVLVSLKYGDGTAAVRVNGQEEITAAFGSSGTSASYSLKGVASTIGGYDYRFYPFTGRIGQVFGFKVGSGSLDAGFDTKLEGYLAHKWGLTGSLPAGHPYKTSAPTA